MTSARPARHVAPAVSVAASLLAATSLSGERGTQFALVVAQTAAVFWLGQLAWSRARGWATAGIVLTAAWIPTFLVSSWIYAIDPSLLDVGSPTQALAIIQLSLFALIAGFRLWPRELRVAVAEHVALAPAGADPRALVTWSLVGLAGLATVLEGSGGAIHYVQNLNHEGSLTQGRAYFVVLALALPFVAQVVVCLRWSRGLPVGRLGAAGVAVTLALVGVLSARLLIALALAQLALFYGLTRRRPSVSTLSPFVVGFAVALILGGGAVKRFTSYHEVHPHNGVGLVRYLWSVAPAEIPVAYANNYADGVRLVALSRITVPRHAGYEYGKELLRLALQPLPHGIRPLVAPSPALKAALYPGGGNAYAQPLQAVSYLQFGLPGVVVTFLLFGGLLAELDYRLALARGVRPSSLVLLTAVVVDFVAVVRGPFSQFVAFALASLVVLYGVARTSERLLAGGERRRRGASRGLRRPARLPPTAIPRQ